MPNPNGSLGNLLTEMKGKLFMKAVAAQASTSQEISPDLEIRVDQAVDSFLKSIDQMLAEEYFSTSRPLDCLGLSLTSDSLIN